MNVSEMDPKSLRRLVEPLKSFGGMPVKLKEVPLPVEIKNTVGAVCALRSVYAHLPIHPNPPHPMTLFTPHTHATHYGLDSIA